MTRAILFAFAVAGLLHACYATTGPVVGPNPADYPPLNDDRTLFAVRHDGGVRG